MNTDFAAKAFDDAIALQNIKVYCQHHMKDADSFGGYDGGVYDTCWDILELIKESTIE